MNFQETIDRVKQETLGIALGRIAEEIVILLEGVLATE